RSPADLARSVGPTRSPAAVAKSAAVAARSAGVAASGAARSIAVAANSAVAGRAITRSAVTPASRPGTEERAGEISGTPSHALRKPMDPTRSATRTPLEIASAQPRGRS